EATGSVSQGQSEMRWYSSFALWFCLVQSVWPAPSGEFLGHRAIAENSQAVAAAAATAAVLHPAGGPCILLMGKRLSLWERTTPPAQENAVLASDRAPLIDADILAEVEDRAPVRNAAENYAEAAAYNYVLVQASATPVMAFAKSARRDLTFAHLFEEPGK